MEQTRRNFLKMTALGAAAITGSAMLASCAPAQQASNDEDEQGQQTIQADSQESCDILVAGSGTAGTFAAIRAAQLGANVIWVEKTGSKGGTSVFTEGIAGVNSKVQQDAGMSFEGNDVYFDLMEYQDWGALGNVVSTYVDNCGATIDWLAEQGVDVRPGPVPGYPATSYLHMTYVDDQYVRNGDGMLKPLWAIGDSMDNLDFRLNTKIIGLVSDDSGVHGAYIQGDDDTITEVSASAVILATGGFSGNQEMYEQYTQSPYERIKFWGLEGRDGDAIIMGQNVGAASHGLRCLSFSYGCIEGTSAMDDEVNVWMAWCPLLTVNAQGDRFMDETMALGEDTSKRNIAIMAQNYAYMIADEAYITQCADLGAFNWGTGVTKGQLRQSLEECSGVVQADTLEELAQTIGVDADTLQASVDEYNAIAAGKQDDVRFRASAEGLIPIGDGPYYAGKIVASGYGTIGGLESNERFQATKEDGSVISGLYVAGNDNGSMYYISYPMAVMGGTCQAFAATSGRLAAEDAFQNITQG